MARPASPGDKPRRGPSAPTPRRRRVEEGEAPEPRTGSLKALREAAADCKRCPLWKPATQTVFGEGSPRSRILVVGEQPGDKEDLSGHPFVGPAGTMLDRALAALGIDRATLYVTNAVKHFKFEQRGKRRLHRSPQPSEQAACRIWLERELAAVKPGIVVALGAIAARNLFGTKFGLMRERGRWHALPNGTPAFATVHPSWILRQRDAGAREEAFAGFVRDLSLLRDPQKK